MAAIDNEHNNPHLMKRIADFKTRQPKGRYVKVNAQTSVFVLEGKDIGLAVENFKKKYGL